jgi:hypothetical protein
MSRAFSAQATIVEQQIKKNNAEEGGGALKALKGRRDLLAELAKRGGQFLNDQQKLLADRRKIGEAAQEAPAWSRQWEALWADPDKWRQGWLTRWVRSEDLGKFIDPGDQQKKPTKAVTALQKAAKIDLLNAPLIRLRLELGLHVDERQTEEDHLFKRPLPPPD